jgi:hypothetical protein
MPLLSTLGNASIQSYGTAGIQPGGSALFSGSQRALSVAPSANFAYGLGDFTVEMWVRPTDYNSWRLLWAQTGGYNSRAYWYFLFYLDRFSGQLAIQMNPFYALHPTAVALNVWSHVAVVRRSNIVTLYVNGVGASSFFGNSNLTDQTVRPTIGNYSILYQAAGQDYQGYLTNVRVAKSAIYTANFTPSRTPFTRTSQGATNVQLLLNHKTSGTLATDSSANNLTVLNTNVTFSTLSPYTEPFVSTTPPVLVSATVTPSSTAVTEGTTITFSVASTNAANGTYYYTIEETAGGVGTLTTADFSSGALSGTFTINGNSGSFPLTVTRDLTTEGDESFSVYVRSTSITGPVLGVSPIIDITDSSLNPEFTVTPASINEGSSGTFTVANVGADGTYFWTILNGTTASADFSSTSGSFVVSGSTGGIDNGTGSFNITPLADRSTEGSQTFQVQVRSGSTSGTVVITSASVTVNDTSLTPSVFISPANIDEGFTYTFQANNLGPAGTYFWTILNGTTTDADFTAVSGSFTTSTLNGTGAFNIVAQSDFTTEGGETFQVQIREGSTSGTVLVTSSSRTVNDISTPSSQTASASPTSLNEGASTTITVSGNSGTFMPSGTYYWTILNGTTTNADFTASSGSFSISGNPGSGSFTVTPAILDGAEGTEFFQVQIRTGSTSGTVIATTGTITINLSAT